MTNADTDNELDCDNAQEIPKNSNGGWRDNGSPPSGTPSSPTNYKENLADLFSFRILFLPQRFRDQIYMAWKTLVTANGAEIPASTTVVRTFSQLQSAV